MVQWINNYKAFGNSAFIRTGHNQRYSIEFKNRVVQSYLSGESSYDDIALKFEIPSKTTVLKWVSKYNGHEKLKTSGTGGNTIIIK